MTVTPSFEATGSILADTAQHRLADIEAVLAITSSAPKEEIAAMVATAERMCFVMDALTRPHTVRRTTLLNGQALA